MIIMRQIHSKSFNIKIKENNMLIVYFIWHTHTALYFINIKESPLQIMLPIFLYKLF